MGLFSTKLVDRDIAEWQFENFALLIENFSSAPALPDSDLWLPIEDHFPSGTNTESKYLTKGDYYFEQVKRQCGFGPDQTFELVRAQTNKGGFLDGGAIVYVSGDTACGTYQYKNQQVGEPIETITYDSDMESKPTQLIATFAHELSHALHMRSRTTLEIEPELYELFTDLTAVYLGYGVFIANSRFGISNNTQGWQAQGAGYLPEADIVFATALFMRIKNIPAEKALEHLKPRLQKMLKKAMTQLNGLESDVEVLRLLQPMKIK